ncbi:MAG: hypothetical protein KAS91_01085 [Candidatus Pacebacteria bacterium]|nr:hypothetical protein [Candidatus Paceibacterota bacterium]
MSVFVGSLSENLWFIWFVLLWTLPWKGVALWKASRNDHKWWFIALLLLNTMAILEIIYIFFFSKKKGIIEKKEEKIEMQNPERVEE